MCVSRNPTINQIFRKFDRYRFSFWPLFPDQVAKTMVETYHSELQFTISKRVFRTHLESELQDAIAEVRDGTRFHPIDVEAEKGQEALLSEVLAITGSDRMPEEPVTEQAATEPAWEEDTQTQASFDGGFTGAQRQAAKHHCRRVLEESYARTLMANPWRVWWLDAYRKQYADFQRNVDLLWY